MPALRRLSVALLFSAFMLAAFTGNAFAAAPLNDNFSAAAPLQDGTQVAVDGMLGEATREAGEPIVTGADTDHTIWFRWKATQNGTLRISTCRDNNSGVSGLTVAIYTGSDVSALTSKAEGTENCGANSDNARAEAEVVAGQVYYVQVGMPTATSSGYPYVAFDFAAAPPANDNYANAQDLGSALPQTWTANNSLATAEVSEPNTDPDSDTNSVWFKWTAPSNGLVAFDTCATPQREQFPDSKIRVFKQGATSAITDLSAVASNDDGCGYNDYLSYVTFTAVSGTTYWLRLTNYSSQYGSTYNLRLHAVGPLTNIAAPQFQDSGFISAGSNLTANPGVWDSGESISYAYTWERCDAAGGNCAATAETSNTQPVVAEDLGYTFRFSVTATDADESVTVRSKPSRPVSEAAANDNIIDAIDLGSALPATRDGANYDSDNETNEIGAPGYYPSQTVWFRWTAPSSGTVLIDLCGQTGRSDADINGILGVYTGDGTIDNSTQLTASTYGCGAPGRPSVSIAAVQGTTYWIQVGTRGTAGSFQLSIHTPPVPAVNPPAVDPVPAFTLGKLGTVKPKKGKVNLKKLSVTCGGSATGNCTGSLTIKSAKKKIKGKTMKSVSQTFKVNVAPGKKLGTSYKLNKKLLKALKQAKKLNATVTVKLGAPGFSQKSAKTSLTLKN